MSIGLKKDMEWLFQEFGARVERLRKLLMLRELNKRSTPVETPYYEGGTATPELFKATLGSSREIRLAIQDLILILDEWESQESCNVQED